MQDAIGWGLAVLAVVVPVGVYIRERRVQAVHFAVLTNRRLITTASPFPLEVSFGGSAVVEPHLVVWRITNAGNHPVRPEDYEQPVRLCVGGSRIVSSDVTFCRPREFEPKIIGRDVSEVTLSRSLMNPRDLVEVQMLVDGEPTEFRVTGRIAGVRDLRQVVLPRTSWDEVWRFTLPDRLIALALSLVGALAGVWFLLEPALWAKAIGAALLSLFIGYLPLRIRGSIRKNSLFLGN